MSETRRFKNFSKNSFIEFLHHNPKKKFRKKDGNCCPIAKYLEQLGYDDCMVFNTFVRFKYKTYKLPVWASNFIATFDQLPTKGKLVTGAACEKIFKKN